MLSSSALRRLPAKKTKWREASRQSSGCDRVSSTELKETS